MPRAAEQGARLAPLDEAAKIHDADEVGDVIDYGEIVADEKVSEAQLALEPLHQVQDLRLHRDVERRGRLVANQELRVAGQSAGDGDALALPAGELVRELRAVRRRQPHLLKQLADARGERLAERQRGACRERVCQYV